QLQCIGVGRAIPLFRGIAARWCRRAWARAASRMRQRRLKSWLRMTKMRRTPMTRTTRVRVAMAITLTLMMGAGREASADAVKCKEAIAKQSATYVQKRSKALQKCEDAKTTGKLPATQVCPSEPKTQSALGVLATKLGLGIASACGGADKTCGTADDDSLAAIGWGSVANCPAFGDMTCTQAIASCSDIATCIQC